MIVIRAADIRGLEEHHPPMVVVYRTDAEGEIIALRVCAYVDYRLGMMRLVSPSFFIGNEELLFHGRESWPTS